jgi:hypothetical protein
MSRRVLEGAALVGLASSAAIAQDCVVRFEQPTAYDGAWRLFTAEGGAAPGLYGTRVYDLATGASLFLARWTGLEWQSIGRFPGLRYDGFVAQIHDLCVYNDGTGDAIYACGFFEENELGEPMRGVAKWNGEQWVDVGGGIRGTGDAMCVFNDGVLGPALYVGGVFDEAGGRPMWNIARWDGDVWSDVGGGVSGSFQRVKDLEVFDDGAGPALFVGGWFTHCAPAQESKGIAKWTGREWVPIGARTQGPWLGPTVVEDMIVHDDGSGPALYVVGTIAAIAGLRAEGIARWDGQKWSNVGATAGSEWHAVYSLAVFDDGAGPKLYVGDAPSEWFDKKETVGLACWDGVEWEDISERGLFLATERPMATLDTSSGQELWMSASTWAGDVLGRLRCVEDCAADCDGSGELDFLDFLCFQNAFAAGEPRAECDENGVLDFFDFLCFQSLFAAGCP